jgi:carbon starvation protein CstA
VPLVFVSVTTLTAGVLSVRDNFWPMAIGRDASKHFQGYLDTILTIIMMVCVLVILTNALWRCAQVLRGRLAIMREPESVLTNR